MEYTGKQGERVGNDMQYMAHMDWKPGVCSRPSPSGLLSQPAELYQVVLCEL